MAPSSIVVPIRPAFMSLSRLRFPRHHVHALNHQQRGLKRFHGPKYQAKIDKAAEEWEYKKQRIQDGKEKHVWDFLEERGFIKDLAGWALPKCQL
jgi:hypothetical protein